MKLKYKAKKLRDFITYTLNIVPVDVDVERREVIVTFNEADIKSINKDVAEIVKIIEPMVDRKVIVTIV